MLNRRVVFLVIAVQLMLPAAALACPLCVRSPNGWGFCKYNYQAGPYACHQYVEDPWTGRTNCLTCGYCNWNDPSANQPCDVGGSGDCGIDKPCDQTGLLDQPMLRNGSCASPSRITGNDLSWMGARVDQVAIF